ncbi:unnamed protein product [Caenorhabditis brenneri]
MGFCLLNLPLVPFREILRMLEFSEIISISFCSQRFQNVTKRNLYKLKEWEICVKAYPNPRIILRKEKEEHETLGVSFGKSLPKRKKLRAKIESRRVGNTLFRIKISNQGYLTSYWPTERIGTFECGKYVADLFQKEIHTIEFEDTSTWLMDLPAYIPQLSISKVVFKFYFFSGVEMSAKLRVFEECSAEHLETFGLIEEAPRFIRFGSFRTFRAQCGLWLTVRHVTNLKCSHISIMSSLWKSVHVNKFLRRWVHGGMPKLECFDIEIVYEINLNEILDGLDQFVLLNSSFEGIGKENEWCTFHHVQIKSKSGLTALVDVDIAEAEKVFRMAVHPHA